MRVWAVVIYFFTPCDAASRDSRRPSAGASARSRAAELERAPARGEPRRQPAPAALARPMVAQRLRDLVCPGGADEPNKWIALAASCYMCLSAGGLMFGWPSLMLMLQSEDQFAERCHGTPAPCAAQESIYHWIWTVASSTCLASSLLTGLLLDALGPRFAATVCALGMVLGVFLIAVHDSKTFNVLLPGMILISALGPGVQNACVHTSNLFKSRSTASSMIIGSFNVSYAVFLLLELVHRQFGTARRQLFLSLCVFVAVAAVLAFLVMPAKPFTEASKKKKSKRPEGDSLLAGGFGPGGDVSPGGSEGSPSLNRQASPQVSAATLTVGRARRTVLVTVLLKEAPLHHQVMSSPFLNLLVWTTVAMFWMNFYIGTVASRLGRGGSVQVAGEEGREKFIELFNLLSPAGVLFLPVIGYIFDKVSFPLGLLITQGFGVLFAGLLLVHTRVALICAWVAYTLFRNCAFATLFSFLTHYLGFQNLGVLVGLCLLVSGLVSMLQPLILRLIALDLNGQYLYVNYLQFASMVLLLYFPVWSFLRERHMRRTDSTDSVTIAIQHG